MGELEGRCATFKAANVRLFHECEKLKVRGVHLEELNLRFARTLQQVRKDHQLEIAGLRRELEAAQSTLQEIDSANRKVKKVALRGKDVKKASQSRETQTTEGGHFFGEQAFDSSVMEACPLVVEPEAVSATPRFSQDCLEEVGPAVRELRGTALPTIQVVQATFSPLKSHLLNATLASVVCRVTVVSRGAARSTPRTRRHFCWHTGESAGRASRPSARCGCLGLTVFLLVSNWTHQSRGSDGRDHRCRTRAAGGLGEKMSGHASRCTWPLLDSRDRVIEHRDINFEVRCFHDVIEW